MPLSLADNKLVEALWKKKNKDSESDPPFLVTYVKFISGNCSLNFCLLTKIRTIVLRLKILLNKITSFLCRFHWYFPPNIQKMTQITVCGSHLKVDGFYFSFTLRFIYLGFRIGNMYISIRTLQEYIVEKSPFWRNR